MKRKLEDWLLRSLRALSGSREAGIEWIFDSTFRGRLGLPASRRVAQSWGSMDLAAFLESARELDFACRAKVPRLSIVLVTHEAAPLTLLCLRSLAAEWRRDYELVWIDNGSRGVMPELQSRARGARCARNRTNRHFVLGANQGAALARGRSLLFLNSDIQLLPGSLEAAGRRLDSSPKVGVVGGMLFFPDGTVQEAGGFVRRDGSTGHLGRGEKQSSLRRLSAVARTVDYCSGSFLLTRTQVFRELGGFDEAFAPAYYEDTDYCARARQAGYRVVIEPRARARHFEGGSHRTRAEAEALIQRNQARFRERHLNPPR